jgi:hypothetical protein
MTGNYHCVTSNSMVVFTTGTGLATDNEITGISLRDPIHCVVANNILKGEGVSGGVVISLDDNTSVSGANKISNNVVSGNTILITNASVAGVVAIRLQADSSTNVSNNIVCDNVISAPARALNGLIQLVGSATAKSESNSVANNVVVANGARGNSYGIDARNLIDSSISGNKIRVEFDASVSTVFAGIELSACSRILVGENHITCSSDFGANTQVRGFTETASGSGNQILNNVYSVDTTKATALLLNVLTTSGVRVEHAGSGSPEAAIVSGVGGLWRRSDGAAATTLYIKESGTSNTGWTAFGSIAGSSVYDPASLNDGDGATTTVSVVGATLGDYAEASFSLDLQGITLTPWVSAADTVSVRFQNETGGTIDLGSGTIRVSVKKP